MSNLVTYQGSGVTLPRASQSKSVIRQFADLVTGGLATDGIRYAEREVGIDPVSAAFDAIGKTGSGGVIGGLLGVAAAADCIDVKGVPVDAATSAISNVIGVLSSRSAVGAIARNVGGQAMAVYSFRKVQELFGAKKTLSAHGEGWDVGSDGEDPILEVAKSL